MTTSVCIRAGTTAPASSWNFEQVYTQYRTAIYKRIMLLVSDREMASDLTQEVFLRAFKALPTLNGPLNMSAWLYRIATNAAYDALRHRQLIRWDPIDALLYEPSSKEVDDPQAQYSGPQEFVRLALERMPARYRTALVLYTEAGYDYAQIAQVLHIAPTGVKMYLSRARRHFRQHYIELEREVAHV